MDAPLGSRLEDGGRITRDLVADLGQRLNRRQGLAVNFFRGCEPSLPFNLGNSAVRRVGVPFRVEKTGCVRSSPVFQGIGTRPDQKDRGVLHDVFQALSYQPKK